MTIKTLPFDAAPFLDDEMAQAEYLSDALATGDAATVAHALGVLARAQGMADVAKQSGLQRENLYRALSDKGRPELATVLKAIAAMGLRLAALPATGERAA